MSGKGLTRQRKLRRKAHRLMLKEHAHRAILQRKMEKLGVPVQKIGPLSKLKAFFKMLTSVKPHKLGMQCAFNAARREKNEVCRQLGITGKRYRAMLKIGRRALREKDPEATFI